MKQLLIILVMILLWTVSTSSPVLAHSAGQPPYFKINGVYADLYPVPGASLPDFVLPQDLAPQTYLMGQRLSFEIDNVALGLPDDVFKKAQFLWDFGDGSTTKGAMAVHSYSKSGSYLLSIKVVAPNLPQPQLFQSVLIHVVPKNTYVIPQAQIKVNGNLVNGMVDIVYADLSVPVLFESVGEGKSYFWDFGDGVSSASQRSVKHSYPVDRFPGGLTVVSAVLRVQSAEGFISDTYTMIYDNSLKPSPVPTESASSSGVNKFGVMGVPYSVIGIVLAFMFAVALGILVFRKK